jgi:hypothetical protein
MRAKRTLMLGMVIALLCTVTAFADSDTFEGYSKAKLRVNGEEVSVDGVPAFVIDGATVIPLRQAAEALHAMVKWNNTTRTADLYKPNVHMLFGEDIEQNGGGLFKKSEHTDLISTFSRVPNGKNLNFSIMVQVDELTTAVDGYRVTVIAPDGTEAYRAQEDKSITDESFWLQFQQKIKFSQKGKYTVKFAFLYDGDYTVVAEKQILSE